jgi:hypothetical protein
MLVEKPEGKRQLARPRCRWKDNIGCDLREVGWGDVYWMLLDEDRDQWWGCVNMVVNHRVP